MVSTWCRPCVVGQHPSAILAFTIGQPHRNAVQLQFMGANGKPVLAGDFFLQGFNLTIFELNNFLALCANEMVMVSLVRHVVELCLHPGLSLRVETLFLREAGLTQKFQRAEHGGKADMRVFPGKLLIHPFGRHVFHSQKSREDVLTLAGQLETVFRKVLFENVEFFNGFGHTPRIPTCKSTLLKLKCDEGSSGESRIGNEPVASRGESQGCPCVLPWCVRRHGMPGVLALTRFHRGR